MRDCRLTMEMKNGKILIQTEKAGMLELAEMIGCLEQCTGMAAFRGGISLEEIKDNLLDIHLAAMQALTDQVIGEGGGARGS